MEIDRRLASKIGLQQIAAGEALGISAKAVETRVYRARKLLAEALKADGIDIDEP